jgi:hypothetical protein
MKTRGSSCWRRALATSCSRSLSTTSIGWPCSSWPSACQLSHGRDGRKTKAFEHRRAELDDVHEVRYGGQHRKVFWTIDGDLL